MTLFATAMISKIVIALNDFIMLKWRKPKLREYILVIFIVVVLTAMLIPTCSFEMSDKTNQKMIQPQITHLIANQSINFKNQGKFISVEKVMSNENRAEWNRYNYDIAYETNDKEFKLWVSPKQYHQGQLSFYIDNTSEDIHGADHEGGRADINDPIVKIDK